METKITIKETGIYQVKIDFLINRLVNYGYLPLIIVLEYYQSKEAYENCLAIHDILESHYRGFNIPPVYKTSKELYDLIARELIEAKYNPNEYFLRMPNITDSIVIGFDNIDRYGTPIRPKMSTNPHILNYKPPAGGYLTFGDLPDLL